MNIDVAVSHHMLILSPLGIGQVDHCFKTLNPGALCYTVQDN